MTRKNVGTVILEQMHGAMCHCVCNQYSLNVGDQSLENWHRDRCAPIHTIAPTQILIGEDLAVSFVTSSHPRNLHLSPSVSIPVAPFLFVLSTTVNGALLGPTAHVKRWAGLSRWDRKEVTFPLRGWELVRALLAPVPPPRLLLLFPGNPPILFPSREET